MERRISISGLEKSRVLAALVNNAKPHPDLGTRHMINRERGGRSDHLSEGDAAWMLYDSGGIKDFWTVNGKPVNVDLTRNDFDVEAYDRLNGQGAAERIVERLRQQNGRGCSLDW